MYGIPLNFVFCVLLILTEFGVSENHDWALSERKWLCSSHFMSHGNGGRPWYGAGQDHFKPQSDNFLPYCPCFVLYCVRYYLPGINATQCDS